MAKQSRNRWLFEQVVSHELFNFSVVKVHWLALSWRKIIVWHLLVHVSANCEAIDSAAVWNMSSKVTTILLRLLGLQFSGHRFLDWPHTSSINKNKPDAFGIKAELAGIQNVPLTCIGFLWRCWASRVMKEQHGNNSPDFQCHPR